MTHPLSLRGEKSDHENQQNEPKDSFIQFHVSTSSRSTRWRRTLTYVKSHRSVRWDFHFFAQAPYIKPTTGQNPRGIAHPP